jgi:hypothetical protein
VNEMPVQYPGLIKRYERDLKELNQEKKELLERLKEINKDIELKRFYCRDLKGKVS